MYWIFTENVSGDFLYRNLVGHIASYSTYPLLISYKMCFGLLPKILI